ncbi:hypothetical protein GA0115240_12842 [Streptomyces sp. DvalAA-14]|nr:hypothetical protein GA0115240_12842 [Streptomyces sp. DvalAA-14]
MFWTACSPAASTVSRVLAKAASSSCEAPYQDQPVQAAAQAAARARARATASSGRRGARDARRSRPGAVSPGPPGSPVSAGSIGSIGSPGSIGFPGRTSSGDATGSAERRAAVVNGIRANSPSS